MTLNNTGIRTILAIAGLGLASYFGVTAGTSGAAVPPPIASQPPPAAQTGPSPQEVARDVADIAMGNGPLTALEGSHGQTTSADCDPSTVSNPPDVSTPTSASCSIIYEDGSAWQQTVTITFDSQGNPVTASTNDGIKLPQPTG